MQHVLINLSIVYNIIIVMPTQSYIYGPWCEPSG